MKSWFQQLFRPSPTRSVFTLVAIGAVLGLAGVLTFEFSMTATSTEKFCTSCHEMADNPYRQLQKTSHYNNVTGVRPTCSDCHVPREFVPNMIRKVEAARDVWGTLLGTIDTPEKYAAHTPIMKAREIARLKANDSQECRNCHELDRMLMAAQSAKAQEYHQALQHRGKTCIDCHAGIAHPENSGSASAHGL